MKVISFFMVMVVILVVMVFFMLVNDVVEVVFIDFCVVVFEFDSFF